MPSVMSFLFKLITEKEKSALKPSINILYRFCKGFYFPKRNQKYSSEKPNGMSSKAGNRQKNDSEHKRVASSYARWFLKELLIINLTFHLDNGLHHIIYSCYGF